MTGKQKLELTWIGKDKRPRLEPRILLEDPEKSYHAKFRRVSPLPQPLSPRGEGSKKSASPLGEEGGKKSLSPLGGEGGESPSPQRGERLGRGDIERADIFDNRLIFGDNLLALKALEQELTGQVKCVFIDPPYNTGSAFTHYDDGLEHSIWLGLIRDRLEIIRRLLSEDGSLWITIDDNECHYLKVLCDEIFGRGNFVAHCLWQKVYSERMDARGFSVSHDHLLVYQKSERFFPRQLPKEQNAAQFGFFDESVNKYYRRRSLRKEGSESLRQHRPSMWYSIAAPDGSEIWPIKPDGTEGRWRWKKENIRMNMNELEFVKKEDRWEIYVKQYIEETPTRPPATFWPNEEVGHNHEAKLEVRAFNNQNVFDTPKPERLLKRVMEIATNPNDLVLDSFAGSGTTGAVAHKMGRRWIMVELGEHCHTHIIPRLKKVIDGDDPGGITQTVGWQGGGGFRYYKLAPSLIVNDRWGNPVVNPEYNAAMLAEALCKLEGFTYAPSETHWWQHGASSERDFIYITTQNLAPEQLQALADEVGGIAPSPPAPLPAGERGEYAPSPPTPLPTGERGADALSPGPSPASGRGELKPLPLRGVGVGCGVSLLVCCSAFHGVTAAQAAERWPNLTLKKIPKMVLARCEWGHDDYSLNVANLPIAAPSPPGAIPQREGRKKGKAENTMTLDLFEDEA